jgi:hypothetical protein
MTADSPSAGLTERLNAALDRLEVALETTQQRLAEADEAAAVLQAMTADRAALAARLDDARARAASLETAASDADDEVAVAAKAVRDALGPLRTDVEGSPRPGDGVAGD